MSDHPPEEPEIIDTSVRSGSRPIGLGTVSIMLLFIGIIGAMCLGAAAILTVLILRSV